MNDWIVKINDVGYKIARDIYIFRRTATGTEMVHGDVVEPVDAGATPKATLSLTPEMLQALADALDSSGFKPQKGYLEGKLEATEKHLQDMRTLIKLK